MIKICNVEVMENPSSFLQPFQFKVVFTVDDNFNSNEYVFKIVYVGSPENKKFDQILLSESLGSYGKGEHNLILRSAPIDPDKIPKEELLEPGALLLVAFCNGKQFFQSAYIVVKDYLDNEESNITINYEKVQKKIIVEYPRIILDEDDDIPEGNELVREHIRRESIENQSIDLMDVSEVSEFSNLSASSSGIMKDISGMSMIEDVSGMSMIEDVSAMPASENISAMPASENISENSGS